MLSPASTAHGSPEVTDARSSPDPRPVFYQQPAGLLQWHSGRPHRSADAEATGCSARQIDGARKCDPVSHILCDLHWLPVRQCITSKLYVLAYKCLHRMAPPYLTKFHVLTSSQASRPRLRSFWANSLLVPWTCTCYGDRNIAVASPAAGPIYRLNSLTSVCHRQLLGNCSKLYCSITGTDFLAQ